MLRHALGNKPARLKLGVMTETAGLVILLEAPRKSRFDIHFAHGLCKVR
jgi:hypothetical protein